MEKKFEVNKELINDASSMKLYKYLFGEENDSKTVDFRFIVLDIKNSDEKERIASVFLDVFAVSTLLYIDKRPIVFYSEEQDFEVKNLLWSIIDDFGINMSIFNSGKIKNRESFFTVLSLFEKYIARKNYQYYGVSDLILEIVKEDIKELSKYRNVLLNNISEDPQIEKLILSLFDNNLNITKTAKDVYMHRNTINNKLEYITKETGLNIQEFKDALSMYWLINAK